MEEVIIYDQMLGKVFDRVVYHPKEEIIVFVKDGIPSYLFYHNQCCCESVYLEDIVGDLSDLEGSPLLEAEEYTSNSEDDYESLTYTYYKFATLKGSVSIRWCGRSNGYYSERVDFLDLTKEDNYYGYEIAQFIKDEYGGITNGTS